MVRLIECVRATVAIFRGKAIIIEDKGDSCRTFVGSEISKQRLKVLMVNQLKTQTIQT